MDRLIDFALHFLEGDMKKIIPAVLLMGLLTACGEPYVVDDTPALQSQVKVGDVLRLHNDLTFLPTVRKLTFQFSEITGSGAMQLGAQKYQPDCALMLNKKYYRRVEVPSQDFTVTRVQPYSEPAILDMLYYGVRLYLQSPKQSEVEMLDCRYPGESYEEGQFTIRMFDTAVGRLMSIKRAQ
jgi:hypothetical protein